MAKNIVSCFLIVGLFILAGSLTARAGGTGPVTDTIPGSSKNPSEANAKKNGEPIKEVPKSRKQEKPVAVPAVAIKPVIVKPKIIVQPIIKIH